MRYGTTSLSNGKPIWIFVFVISGLRLRYAQGVGEYCPISSTKIPNAQILEVYPQHYTY